MDTIGTGISGQGAPVGHVDTADGPVFAVRADGVRVPLQKGDAVLPGDQLETGQGGAVSITFADHSSFSLGEKGAMAVDEFVYNPAGGEGSSVVSVMEGVFVFVSGQIAKTMPDAMMVKTPVMSIGVRGTKVAGTAGQEGQHNAVTLLQEDDGQVGEIAVMTAAGTQVLNQALQTVKLASALDVPKAPVFLSPLEVKGLYGQALDAAQRAETRADGHPQPVKAVPVDRLTDPVPLRTPDQEVRSPAEEALRPDQPYRQPLKFDPLADRLDDLDLAALRTLDKLSSVLPDPYLLRLPGFRFLEEPEAKVERNDPTDSTAANTPNVNVINGTGGSDTLLGTPGHDEILGYSGNDMIYGYDSADKIFGGLGDDAVYAGLGDDRVYGEAGADRLLGEGGNDVLAGGLGDDTLYGGDGKDVIVGGDGADNMTGGSGADTFVFYDPSEGLSVAANIPVPNLPLDTITDFVEGEDVIQLLASAFRMSAGHLVGGVNFEKIVGTYDGTNGTSSAYGAGDAAFILDGDGNLCWDHNGDSAGYTVVANVGDPNNVSTADISLV